LLSETGDHAGAIATTTAALAKAPGDLWLLVARGVAYAKAGDPARAEKDFAAARSKAVEPEQLNDICWTKATAGVMLDSALADCDAALIKAPDAAPILDSRAFVLLRLGRLDDAIGTYDRALAKYPRLAPSLFGRSIAWSRKGDKAKSDADASAALKIDPDVKDRFERYGIKL